MPTEGEAGLSLTSFPTSHLVQVGGQPSNESGLAALPKLFKSLFSAGSSDSTPFTKHRSNSLDKSEVGHKEGNARRARTRTALADVPEDAEGQQLASHSKSPARPTRLSMLGRTNPSIGLTLQHDDAHSSNTNIPPATDQGSTFEGSASAYDLSSSLNRYNSRAQHDDAQSVTSFATSNHNRRAQHQHTDSDALNTVHQVIQKMKGGGISQSFWIPDESTTQCYACQLPFNTFRRKHHCRVCGQIFCSPCASNLIDGSTIGVRGYLRICKGCIASNPALRATESISPSSPARLLGTTGGNDSPSTPTSRLLSGLGLDEDRMSFKSRPQSSSRRPTISAPLESHVRPPQSQFAAATLFPRAEFPASAYPDDDDALPPPSPAFNNFSAPNSPFQASPTFFADSPDLPHPDIATPGLSGAAGQYAPFRKHASAQEEHGLPVDIEAMSATGSHCGSPEALTSRLGPPLAHRATTPTIPFPSLGTDETSRTKPLPPTLARSASATLTTNSIEGLGINMGPPIKDPAIDSLAALQTDIGPRSTTSDQSEVQQQPVRPSLGPMELPARPDTPSSGSGPGGHSRRPSSLQRTRSRVSSLTTDPSDEMPGGTPRGRKESLATIETEVTSLNLQFVKQLLSQVLLQSGLKPEDWEQTLLHLLIQVTKTVRTLPRPENIDVSRHVKVKKLPGGRPKHCEYVDGLVFTKNLLRKQMPREKKRPRLMLLSYPIEYQRQDQLSSLAPIIHQEKIYLSNLVERITALRPHIVLVDQAVSGRAVDYLADRGIAVARNVKPSVMKALSRAFNTEIISSLDQLSLRPSLGRCETFQVQTFVHNMIPGKRKTLLRFEGTHRDIVSTLILRGGDLSTLGRVKDVVRFMIKVAFNLRMESFLFHDEHVSVLNPPSLTYQLPERAIDGDFQGDTDLNEEKLPDNSASDSVSRALQPYLSRILSNTPFTVFSPPYPLLQMKLEDSNLRHIRYLYDHEEAQRILREELECRQADSSADSSVLQCPPLADGSPPVSRAFELGNALSRSASQHSLDSIGGLPSSSRPAFAGTYAALAITSPLSKVPEVSSLAAQLERAQDQHATTLTRFSQYLASDKPVIDPRAHQEIVVLRSIFHSATLKPCKVPELTRMRFYTESDQTLGSFLEDYADQVTTPCSNSNCGESALVHYKVFVHGQRRVTCVLEQFPCPVPGGQDRIYMWSYCKLCQTPAKHTVMNEQTWQYSFAKYLELSFYGGELGCRTIYPSCSHNVHTDHVRYFALRNLAVRVYSDPIEVLEVCPPPLEIKVHADVRARLRLDEMRSMSNRFDAFWTSLHQRLNAINLESCASDKVEEARRIIESFHQRFEFEQSQIKRMLFETYRDSVSSSGLSFADVRRTMQEKVVEWDAAFASFEQSFLPTEKDLRRLTGTQLRKLFDSGPSQATESRITSPLLSPAVEEKEASDDGLDSLSLLSLPDVPSGLPLSEANLAAIDFKLGDLPSSRPATAGATIVRTYSAPLLPAPSQTGINSKAIDNPLPVAIQESTESAESDTGSDTTVCADLPVSSQSGVVQSEQAPHLERTGSASSAKTSATPIASQSGHSRPSQISSHGVSDLVRQFDLSSPPSRAREDSFSETEVRRPVFKRGHSDYARAMAYSKKRSGTITDPESLPSSRPRSPESKGLSKRHKEPSQNAGRERPNLSRGNTARLHTSTRKEGMSKQSTLKRPKMPASAGSQVESSGAVGLSARSGAPLAERKSRESSRAPSLGRMKGDRAPSQRAPGQRRVASAATGSRVSTLARHFDRMSREAERDRNKKLAALRSKRAKPVGVSKAVIEVYADAREALREDSDESDVEDAEGAGADDEADDAELSRLQATSPKGKSREREKTVTAPTENESAPTSKNEQIPAESSTFPVEPAFERIVPSSLTSSTPVSPGLPPSSMPSSSKAAPQSESEMSSSGTEKSSIMKTISSLWGARNCEFVPLAYPLRPTEHLVANNPVLVREDEPSSLLAYALASSDYREKITYFQQDTVLTEDRSEVFMPGDGDSSKTHGTNNSSGWGLVDVAEASSAGDVEETPKLPLTEHFGLQFDAGGYEFSCKVFFAPQFAQLRSQCVEPQAFVESLARCVKWNASGGKSGSAFLKTRDDRFVVKEISRLELEAFLHFALEYFSHINQSFANGVPTLMAKILGLFRVSFVTNGRAQRMDLLVMENLFYDRNVTRIYDLKGSKRNRHVVTTGKRGEVLLDENLTEVAYKSPLFVRELSKHNLRMALYNDTIWFAKHNIMDYSLIVGVDQEKDELVVGIVDFIRTYTWDKKLESWVKGARNEPTIITPKLYKNRLRGACEEYFVLAPDHWTTDAAFLQGKDAVAMQLSHPHVHSSKDVEEEE